MSVNIAKLRRRSTSSVSTVYTPDRSQPIAEPSPQPRTDQFFQLSARADESCEPTERLQQPIIGCRSFARPAPAANGFEETIHRSESQPQGGVLSSRFTHRGGPARTGSRPKRLALDDTTSVAESVSKTSTHPSLCGTVMESGQYTMRGTGSRCDCALSLLRARRGRNGTAAFMVTTMQQDGVCG